VQVRFDRGTILITEAPAGLDLSGAPGVVWDGRVQAHRAPGCAYPVLARWLARTGMPFVDGVRREHAATDGWVEVGRACTDDDLPAGALIVRFRRHVDATAVWRLAERGAGVTARLPGGIGRIGND